MTSRSSPRTTGPGRISVLHVDDDPDFAAVTADLLEHHDDRLDVRTATGADEALDLFAECAVDCIVADYEMPDRDGIELLEAVRERDPDVPFVLYTGKGSEAVASEAISAGVTDYLQKGSGSGQYRLLAKRIADAVDHRRARTNYREVFENSPDGIVVHDPEDGSFVDVNGRYAELFGYDRRELLDAGFGAIHPGEEPYTLEGARERIRDLDGPRTFEWPGVTREGDRVWTEVHLSPIRLHGTDRVLAVVRDVTDRKRRERALDDLHATARDCMRAGSSEAVARIAVDAMRDALDLGTNAVFLHEEGSGELSPVAWTDRTEAAVGSIPGFARGEGPAWAAFETGPVTVDDDPAALPGPDDPGGGIRSGLLVPVGDHGVVFAGSTEADAFDDLDVSLVRILATHVEAALDRIARERELGESHQQLRTLVDHFPGGGVFLYDEDLACTFAGGAELADVGLDPGDVVGRRPGDRYPPAIANELERNLRVALDGTSTTFEQSYEGRRYRIQTVPVGGDDGRTDEAMAVSQDITDRYQYERAVAALHEVARDLADCETVEEVCRRTVAAAEDVLSFDLSVFSIEEGGLLRVRAASEDFSPADYDTLDVDEGIAGRTYRTGEDFLVADIADHEAAKPQGPFQSAISLPVGDHGNFQAVAESAGAFDEQDLELARLLVAHAGSNLDRLDRERELERQNDRLERFANTVSHDLRNPLEVAYARLELARSEVDSPHFEELDHALGRIDALIDDVLTLARQGTPIDEPEPVALSAVAEASWRVIDSAGATLAIERDDTLRADRDRLRQLLENLFRNSVEHGGDDVTVRVGVLEDGDGIYVADDGVGIPRDERSAVFESGYSTAPEGTGFGLSIVEEIADAHGWAVDLTASDAGGARFEITGVEILGE